jgi:hypothetical protein
LLSTLRAGRSFLSQFRPLHRWCRARHRAHPWNDHSLCFATTLQLQIFIVDCCNICRVKMTGKLVQIFHQNFCSLDRLFLLSVPKFALSIETSVVMLSISVSMLWVTHSQTSGSFTLQIRTMSTFRVLFGYREKKAFPLLFRIENMCRLPRFHYDLLLNVHRTVKRLYSNEYKILLHLVWTITKFPIFDANSRRTFALVSFNGIVSSKWARGFWFSAASILYSMSLLYSRTKDKPREAEAEFQDRLANLVGGHIFFGNLNGLARACWTYFHSQTRHASWFHSKKSLMNWFPTIWEVSSHGRQPIS